MQIDALFPFLFFPMVNLVAGENLRQPDIVFEDPLTHRPTYGAVLLHREFISIVEDASCGIHYVQEAASLPAEPRRGFDNDIRWAVDFREIDPVHATLKSGCRSKPGDGTVPNERLGAHILFRSGVLSAGFPCPLGPPIGFLHTQITRRFAQELVVEMELAESDGVTLRSQSFTTSVTPARDLKLRNTDGRDVEVLVGNGPITSIYDLASGRCHGHDHSGPVDYEFEVMYDLLDYPEGRNKPVPVSYAELIRDCYSMML
ncbi:MAG TPA: hypothetical protein VJZ76_06870 [Thermoanaerobaculia bacterium]|nr:hypothetical protein [Thermoanaerobaculia bacterium]